MHLHPFCFLLQLFIWFACHVLSREERYVKNVLSLTPILIPPGSLHAHNDTDGFAEYSLYLLYVYCYTSACTITLYSEWKTYYRRLTSTLAGLKTDLCSEKANHRVGTLAASCSTL